MMGEDRKNRQNPGQPILPARIYWFEDLTSLFVGPVTSPALCRMIP